MTRPACSEVSSIAPGTRLESASGYRRAAGETSSIRQHPTRGAALDMTAHPADSARGQGQSKSRFGVHAGRNIGMGKDFDLIGSDCPVTLYGSTFAAVRGPADRRPVAPCLIKIPCRDTDQRDPRYQVATRRLRPATHPVALLGGGWACHSSRQSGRLVRRASGHARPCNLGGHVAATRRRR